MRFVIDGYNLLFAIGRLGPRSDKVALGAARRWLLQQLRQGHETKADVTVVFDGVGRGEESGGIGVVYSHAESADDVIEEMIRADPVPRHLTVVSNDQRLKAAARRRGCRVLACLDYFDQLGAAPRDEGAEPVAETKPEPPTAAEAQRWLHEFGDGGDDPLLRDLF